MDKPITKKTNRTYTERFKEERIIVNAIIDKQNLLSIAFIFTKFVDDGVLSIDNINLKPKV